MKKTKKGKDRHIKSIVKAISWRVIATLTTFALVLIFTKKINLALGVGIFDILLKLLFYYFHERAWNITQWGTHR